MRWYVLAAPAAAGALFLTGSCSNPKPEDVTPSYTPTVSKGAGEDSASAHAGGGLSDTAVMRDSMSMQKDSLHSPADSVVRRDSM